MNGIAMGITTYQCGWSSPVLRIRRKVAIDLYWSAVGLLCLYDCVRRVIVSYFISLSIFLIYTGFGSPEGLRLKSGIM